MENFSFGCIESPSDKKRVYHEELVTMADPNPTLIGGYDYAPNEIEHQHKVGVCTAISLTQNARKAIGRRFNADFQYLLQKKYIDGNWSEGSAILSALKVGKKYGFLPEEEWTWTNENDRLLPYSAYIIKLQAVPDSEIQRLIILCSDYKLDGYAQVDVTDPMALSRAITASKSGILCMYLVGEEWWKSVSGYSSWNPIDINPLRAPAHYISGHAITRAKFDYTKSFFGNHPNTWGPTWCNNGTGDINWLNYKMREAWIPYYGLTEAQTIELKKTLEAKIGLLQRILSLWITLKSLLKK